MQVALSMRIKLWYVSRECANFPDVHYFQSNCECFLTSSESRTFWIILSPLLFLYDLMPQMFIVQFSLTHKRTRCTQYAKVCRHNQCGKQRHSIGYSITSRRCLSYLPTYKHCILTCSSSLDKSVFRK